MDVYFAVRMPSGLKERRLAFCVIKFWFCALQAIDFWIFHAKCAATGARGSTTASTAATGAPGSSSAAFTGTGSTRARRPETSRDAAPSTRRTETSAEPADSPNASSPPWTKTVIVCIIDHWFAAIQIRFGLEIGGAEPRARIQLKSLNRKFKSKHWKRRITSPIEMRERKK